MRKLLSVPVFLLAAASICAAQTPSRRPTQRPAVASIPAGIPDAVFTPLVYAENIPISAHEKNVPEKLYAWIESARARELRGLDSFSTQEERDSSVKLLHAKMQAASPVGIIGTCQRRYDADLQHYFVRVPVRSIKDSLVREPALEALNVHQVPVSAANRSTGTYTGQNAFGATTQVRSATVDSFVLAFASENAPPFSIGNSRYIPYPDRENFIDLSWRMSSALAREADPNIVCLYVIALQAPYSFSFQERISPTRDAPIDVITSAYAIFGSIEQISVVNRRSGETYASVGRVIKKNAP